MELESKKPTEIDSHVGSRIKVRRRMLHMTQSALSEKIGVAFQQLQKYENGTNRVSASRLQTIADVLGVNVAYFFRDDIHVGDNISLVYEIEKKMFDFMGSNEGVALNQAFFKIKSPALRQSILTLVTAAAEREAERSPSVQASAKGWATPPRPDSI